jgi:hypothetical protein
MFLILILNYNLGGIIGADTSASLNFKGEWNSKEFSSISDWKSFVNTFTEIMFKFKIAEKNGTIQFGVTDSDGNDHFLDTPVKYNNSTGKLEVLYPVTLPSGEVRYLDYKASLNGESDLRKVVNPTDYFGKTIGEIVKDVLSQDIKIDLVGERSNITMTANENFSLDNPIIDINYQKNIGEDFTSPIIEENDEEIVINNSNSSLNIISTNTSENLGNGSIENLVLNDSNEEVVIENPNPYLEEISMFVNQTKSFSVENSKNDSIKWYLDGKLIKKDVTNYSFKGLKIGTYNISVEVREGLENQKYVWSVEVKAREIPQKKSNLWLWIIMGFIFVVFFGGVVYYLKRQGENKDLQPNSATENN